MNVMESRGHAPLIGTDAIYAGTILREGYVEVELPDTFLPQRIAAIRAGMQRIMHDAELAAQMPWQTFASDAYGRGYEQEVGLEYRDDDEQKWKYQYASGCFKAFADSPTGAVLRPFFQALDDLDLLSKRLALKVAMSFDAYASACGIDYGAPLTEKLMGGVCVTRILCYPYIKGLTAQQRAKPHFDRCFVTPHWWGSHPGLKLYTPKCEWKRVDETSLEKIALFPGEKFAACTDGAFKMDGTAHGVWCEPSLKEDRMAIVSFVHPRAYPADCEWLRRNAERIKAFEESLRA